MLTTAPKLTLSTQSIAVSELNLNTLDEFYGQLPYRYNSIIDLLFQEEGVKNTLLHQLNLQEKLFYRVFVASNGTSQLPVLDCLEIDGYLGGMLSTYLHDLDRSIIEGKGDLQIPDQSMFVWRMLTAQNEFSFVFPASQRPDSRTSHYMNKIGFKERIMKDSRCFFNGCDHSDLFVDVMRELRLAILGTSDHYTFDRQRFEAAKGRQTQIVKQWSAGF